MLDRGPNYWPRERGEKERETAKATDRRRANREVGAGAHLEAKSRSTPSRPSRIFLSISAAYRHTKINCSRRESLYLSGWREIGNGEAVLHDFAESMALFHKSNQSHHERLMSRMAGYVDLLTSMSAVEKETAE